MAAVFACIVQPKVIEFSTSECRLHRAQKDEELRAELDALAPPAAPQQNHSSGSGGAPEVHCHPGGGCRLLTRDEHTSAASVGSAVCVFEGSLLNAIALAETYAPVPEDAPTPAAGGLSVAKLMCHMYAKVGVEMLGLLRGSFTFVLYESKTSRVLAARDGTGRCPLFQARTARDSLVLSSNRALLEGLAGCHDVVEFMPGDFKYGWSATPRRYQPAEPVKPSRRSMDGHHHQSGASRRSSMDLAPGAAASPPGPNRLHSFRASLDHHDMHGAATTVSPHPHRTYMVSADDPRVVKAAAGTSAPSGGKQHPPAAHHGHGHGHGHVERPGSGRRQSSSMGSPGGRLAAELAQQAHRDAQKREGQKNQQGQAGGGGGSRRGSMGSRPGADDRPGAKQQQGQGQAKADKEAGAAVTASASLRVDAPEWKPAWVATSKPVAVPVATATAAVR